MKALSYVMPDVASGTPKIEIVERPIPQVRTGRVLVRVHFAGLNNFDLETSKETRNRALKRALKRNPVVSGIEMSGIAESDGERVKAGDRVVGYTHIFSGPFFHCQYVVVPEASLAMLPDQVTLEGAASIVGGAVTSQGVVKNRQKNVVVVGGLCWMQRRNTEGEAHTDG